MSSTRRSNKKRTTQVPLDDDEPYRATISASSSGRATGVKRVTRSHANHSEEASSAKRARHDDADGAVASARHDDADGALAHDTDITNLGAEAGNVVGMPDVKDEVVKSAVQPENAVQTETQALVAVAPLPAAETELFARPIADEGWRRVLGSGKFRKLNGEIIENIFSFFDAVGAAIASKLFRRTRKYGLSPVIVLSSTKRMREKSLEFEVMRTIQLYPSLVHLDLQSCVTFTDKAARFVAMMPFAGKLVSLNLSSTKVADNGLVALAATCTALTQIRLSHCTTCTDVGVEALARSCRLLRWVDVSATGAADEAMVALANSCPDMVFADFSWCPGSDRGVDAIARLSTALQSLRMPARATDVGVDAVSHYRTALFSLGLVRLQVTDDALIRAAQNLVGLRSLHVAHCELVSDRGLEGAAVARPTLTAFNLRTPGMLVSDRGVGHVVRNCTGLRSLKLRACSRITDLALESIAINLKLLHALELHTLTAVTVKGVDSAVTHCALMRRLTILACQQIGAREAEAMMKLVATRPPPIYDKSKTLGLGLGRDQAHPAGAQNNQILYD